MSVLIKFRRDTAANWTSVNPTLDSGEPGFETNTGKLKIGDGTTDWNSLPYAGGGAVTEADISLSDVTTDDSTTSRHGFLKKLSGLSGTYMNGMGQWATLSGLTEAEFTLADNTVNDVSITKHGFTPKAPNDITKYLRGDGTWAVVGASGISGLSADTLWDAKGDLTVGLTNNSAGILSIGATNGWLLVVDSAQTYGVKWAAPLSTSPPAGSSSLVYRYTVTGSDKVSIDTGVDTADAGSNDWTNGDLLEVFILVRTDDAAANPSLAVNVNNDSGGNYDRQFVRGNNATTSAAATIAGTNWAFLVHGAGGSAGYPAVVTLTLPGFARTTFNKLGHATSLTSDATAGNNDSRSLSIGWRNTAAINRLAITPTVGGSKLKVGTQLLIYKRLTS